MKQVAIIEKMNRLKLFKSSLPRQIHLRMASLVNQMIGPIKGGTIEFKFLAMPNVDFEMRVSSVELE